MYTNIVGNIHTHGLVCVVSKVLSKLCNDFDIDKKKSSKRYKRQKKKEKMSSAFQIVNSQFQRAMVKGGLIVGAVTGLPMAYFVWDDKSPETWYKNRVRQNKSDLFQEKYKDEFVLGWGIQRRLQTAAGAEVFQEKSWMREMRHLELAKEAELAARDAYVEEVCFPLLTSTRSQLTQID